jgi:hypothetical protein
MGCCRSSWAGGCQDDDGEGQGGGLRFSLSQRVRKRVILASRFLAGADVILPSQSFGLNELRVALKVQGERRGHWRAH